MRPKWFIKWLFDCVGPRLRQDEIQKQDTKVDRCICCGEPIPEGRCVCWRCEHEGGAP